MERACARCHEPLTPDLAILDDARRAEVRLDFVPLKCPNAHTARLSLPRPRAVRYVPTCGYCGAPVVERKAGPGGSYLNHRECTSRNRGPAVRPHEYVEVELP